MHLRQLTYFVQVAEFGSISAAAVFLKVAQPAVSRQVQQLEEETGATLILRHGRGISLTEAGACLLQRARAILAEADEIRHDLRALSSQPQGEVRLGVPAMIAPILVPPLLHRLRESHPSIRIRVVQGLSEEVRKALVGRAIDVGVLYWNKPSATLVCETLHAEDLHFIGPPGAPALASGRIDFARAVTLPLVMPQRGHELRDLVEDAAQRQCLRLAIEFELDALTVIKEVIRSERVYAMLPLVAAWPEIERGQLASARLIGPPLLRRLVLATMPSGLSAAARLVARAARSEFQGLLRQGRWFGDPCQQPADTTPA